MIWKDRVAVVTGAGGTLCSEIAVNLAEKGMKVVLIGRTASKLEKTAEKIAAVKGVCRIESGDVEGNVLAGERLLLGNEHSRVIITGGNIRIFPENNQTPVSPAGLPLFCQTPPGDHFEQVCKDKRSTWTYVADRTADGQLFVWLPR